MKTTNTKRGRRVVKKAIEKMDREMEYHERDGRKQTLGIGMDWEKG